MSRITNLASSTQLVNIMLRTQQRLLETEVQVSTEKKSQTYAGISDQSQRLLDIETSRDSLERFVSNNELMDLRLKTTEAVVDGMKKTIRDFRGLLFEFELGTTNDEQAVRDIQDAAFRALLDMQVNLNTDVDGRFVFGGGRLHNQPTDFGLTTLADFQATYDGDAVIYPPLRAAHVENTHTVDSTTSGGLTMSGTDTITAANANVFAAVEVGTVIEITDSANGNNGLYTVVSKPAGNQLTIAGMFTAGTPPDSTDFTITNTVNNGADATANISVGTANYYSGDTLTQTHRVASDREFTIGLNGIDPAFEKAIRAMGIIAQGQFNTAGGLDQHPERIDQALYLLNFSLDITEPGTPPFGAEESSNINQIETDLGYQRVIIDQVNDRHETLIAFFEQRVAETENVDQLDAVARLLDDQQALEASFQVISRTKQLSLVNFLT